MGSLAVGEGGWRLWVSSTSAGQGPGFLLHSCCAPGPGAGSLGNSRAALPPGEEPGSEGRLALGVGLGLSVLPLGSGTEGWGKGGLALFSVTSRGQLCSSQAGDMPSSSAAGTSTLAAGKELRGSLQASQALSSAFRPLTYSLRQGIIKKSSAFQGIPAHTGLWSPRQSRSRLLLRFLFSPLGDWHRGRPSPQGLPSFPRPPRLGDPQAMGGSHHLREDAGPASLPTAALACLPRLGVGWGWTRAGWSLQEVPPTPDFCCVGLFGVSVAPPPLTRLDQTRSPVQDWAFSVKILGRKEGAEEREREGGKNSRWPCQTQSLSSLPSTQLGGLGVGPT